MSQQYYSHVQSYLTEAVAANPDGASLPLADAAIFEPGDVLDVGEPPRDVALVLSSAPEDQRITVGWFATPHDHLSGERVRVISRAVRHVTLSDPA